MTAICPKETLGEARMRTVHDHDSSYDTRESIRFECPLSRLFLTATHRVGVLPKTVAGSKDTVETGEVHTRLWHQCSQPGNEVQRVEDHMCGPIAIGCLQFVADVAVGCEEESLFRDCRPRDVPDVTREALQVMAGIFYDLGDGSSPIYQGAIDGYRRAAQCRARDSCATGVTQRGQSSFGVDPGSP